jgi:hypothetical protein
VYVKPRSLPTSSAVPIDSFESIPPTNPPSFSPKCMTFSPRVGLEMPPIPGDMPGGKWLYISSHIPNSDSAVFIFCATVNTRRRCRVTACLNM